MRCVVLKALLRMQPLPKGRQFIEGSRTEEQGLDDNDYDQPLSEAEDSLEVLRYHWVSDVNVFPNER
jgi:hypothetical protein